MHFGTIPGLVSIFHRFEQIRLGYMGISRGRFDARVPQQLLRLLEISAVAHEPSCRRVAQVMESEVGDAGRCQHSAPLSVPALLAVGVTLDLQSPGPVVARR